MSLYAIELGEAHKVSQIGDPERLTKLEARDLMIAIVEAEDERDGVEALKLQIVGRYQSKIDRLNNEIKRMREMMQVYIERVNEGDPAAYPDVGVAYLSKRPDNIAIAEEDQFCAWAEQEGFTIVDLQAARAEAKVRLKDIGEIAPGCEVVAGQMGLTLRRAE